MKTRLLPIITLMAASLALLMGNSEVLMLAEYRNPVAANPEVWSDLMLQPMGLLAWLGCWLTQMFHAPWLGALMLSAIWTGTFAMLCRRFRLEGVNTLWAALPIAALICSITALGYWIYCTRLIGYFVSHSLAMLIISAVLLGHKNTIFSILSAVLLYPVMGFWAVALGVVLAAGIGLSYPKKTLAIALATAISPWAWYAICYSNYLTPSKIYLAGLPFFENENVSGAMMLIPLLAAAICTATMGMASKIRLKPWMAYSIGIAALAAAIWTSDHGDSFSKEIRMTCAAADADWETVKNVARKSPEHTETMKALYELALTQDRTLGEEAFRTKHSDSENPECAAIKVTALYIANHILHYYYGHYNISTRWCMEMGSKYGFGIGLLRQMAMAADGGCESMACQKYQRIINLSLYYRNWRVPARSQVTDDFHSALHDILESDRRCYEHIKYQTSTIGNIGNQTTAETAMYHAMRDRNKANFNNITSMDSLFTRPLATHFQEACAIFSDSLPQYVSPQVQTRFSEFQDLTARLRSTGDKSMVKPIYQKFGETYWWYVYFEK